MIDLALDDVDVAIRVTASLPMSDQVIAQPLTSWKRILVAAPRYLRRRGTPTAPAELTTHAMLASGRDTRWTLTDGVRTAEIQPRSRLATNAGHVLRDLARDGHGIALLPAWFATRDPKLARVLPAWEGPITTIYLLYRVEARKQRRLQLVVNHLRRTYPLLEHAA